MNLNGLTAPIYLGFIYILIFPIGYLLLDFKAFKNFHGLPLSIRLPIYLTFGMLSSTVIYSLMGLRIIDALLPIGAFSLSLLLLILKKRGERGKLNTIDYKSFLFKGLRSCLPIILFLFCFAYFSYVVGYIKWPTPSDAINHGIFTTQIIHGKNIFTIGYPPGFHVTAANLSLSMNLYPGEGIFILACSIMVLIPSILYSLTYINTRSWVLSLLAFMSAFLINASYELEHWLVSSFLIGRYAAIYGYLAVFMFCIFISFEKNSKQTLSLSSIIPSFFISIFLLMTYPSYAIFVLIYLIYYFSVNVRKVAAYFFSLSTKMKSVMIFLLSITIVGLSYIIFQLNIIKQGLRFIQIAPEGWRISLNFFYDWRFGFLIFLSAAIAVLLIFKRSNLSIGAFYLMVFTPIISSLNNSMYPYLAYLLPKRAILMIPSLSWVLFSIGLHLISHKGSTGKARIYLALGRRRKKRIKISYLTTSLVLVLFASQFMPTLISHLSFMQARGQYADWYLHQKGFTSDFEALEWIDKNIPPGDLILNDFAYSSFYLLSFSIKNVTLHYKSNEANPSEQTLDFAEVWKRPGDSAFLQTVIEKYDIKYIFVTSEPRFYDYIMSKKEVVEYTHKFYTPAQYIRIFESYAFLCPIFRRGETVIYKVLS